jgi:hypothetical protein
MAEVQDCGCLNKMREAIKRHVQERYPQATDLEVEVEGYGVVMNFQSGESACFPTNVTGRVPKVKGDGQKVLRLRHSSIASFCPFCGIKYPEAKEVMP